MLEQQRIEYLQAMGIQLWMPREALPNTAESLWLANDSVEKTANDQASGASVQAGHAADLLAGMGLDGPKATLVTQAEKDPVPVSTSQVVLERATGEQKPVIEKTAASDVAAEQELAEVVDLTVPRFELYFALWPCGMLWASGRVFEQKDHAFQTAVSYALLGNVIPQANYSQFKWPYIEGSNEDQSMAVALRALTAQWEFMSGQGARGWIATDAESHDWLSKVVSKPLFFAESSAELFTVQGKKQLWQALQGLPSITTS